VALSADGHLAFSASEDKTLKVWNMATGQVVSTFSTSALLQCCAVTPDGKTIIAGDSIGGVYFLEWV
jgi:WD40 repeat protein